MRRTAIGCALVALVGLAACGDTSSSSEPKTRNAALATTTTLTPAPTTIQATTTTTTLTPVPTTIQATTTTPCVTTMTGNVFKACKPYKRFYYTFFSGTNAISHPGSGYSLNPSVTWTEQNIAYYSLPPISVKVALDYADGTKMPETLFPLDLRGTSPRASLATGAACVPVMDRVILRTCKPYKKFYYTFFSGTNAISHPGSGYSLNPSVTWTEQNIADYSLPPISVKVALDYADGTKMPETQFPLDLKSILAASAVASSPASALTTSTTTPKTAPASTSPARPTTCTISWTGTRLTACMPFRELRYRYFGTDGPVGEQMYATTVTARGWSDLSSTAYPGIKLVRVSIGFIDGSLVSNVDIAIGATVVARFGLLPPPTTTTQPAPPGCDLSVRFGAITPTCGLVKSYTFQWHDGVKTISTIMGAIGGNGWVTISLGALRPPKAATGALMTFTFSNGKKSRNILIPLATSSTTIRAPY